MGSQAKILRFQTRGTKRNEKRCFPRITTPVRALICGFDEYGRSFEVETTLENLSAGGLYFTMERKLVEGETLRFIVRLSTSSDNNQKVAKIAANGRIVRLDSLAANRYGHAAVFMDYHFI